jgi:hypothetical protein
LEPANYRVHGREYDSKWRKDSGLLKTVGISKVSGRTPENLPGPKVQIISGISWLIFLALALYSPWFCWVWGGRGVFSPSEAPYAMRFPLWLLAFFGISQSWLGYTRFVAARWRRILRLGVVAAGVGLAMFLLRSGELLVAGPKWDPTQARSLATLNQMIAGVLVLACIVAGLAFLRKFIRIIRRWNSHSPTGGCDVLRSKLPITRYTSTSLRCSIIPPKSCPYPSAHTLAPMR